MMTADLRGGPMKILLVDDHPLIREGFRGVLTGLKRDACILEAADSYKTMQLLEQHSNLPEFLQATAYMGCVRTGQ